MINITTRRDISRLRPVDKVAIETWLHNRYGTPVTFRRRLRDRLYRRLHRFGVHQWVPLKIWNADIKRLIHTDHLVCRNCR